MKWCNKKNIHLIMVKWCNKSGEMLQRIHTSSYGEMEKHLCVDILWAKWKNYETVIIIFIGPLLCPPPTMGTEPDSWPYQMLHLMCHIWVVPCWSFNCPTSCYNALQCRIPPLMLINIFLLYLFSSTVNTGGVCHLFLLPYSHQCSLVLYWRYII